MGTRTANTVPGSAMPMQEYLIQYRILCAMLDNLSLAGELDTETRDRANAVLAMRTGLKQDSLFL